MATKKANQKNSAKMKITVKSLHDGALHVSDNLIEGSLASGAKLQKIMAKALTEGTGLLAKQQDLVLTTLEEIKGQVVSGNKRFRKLLEIDRPKVKAAPIAKKVVTAKKVVKTTTATVSKTVKATPVAKKRVAKKSATVKKMTK